MIRKRIVSFAVILCAIVMAVALNDRLTRAQSQSPQVITLQAVRHAVSPPLSHIRPVAAAKGLERVVPLLLTHPVPAQRLMKRDPLLQQSAPNPSQAIAGLGFTGIGVGLDGITGDNYIPPDTNGAAGLTQYVQWVNASFAVFNKFGGGVEYGPAAGNTLWTSLGGACATYNSGDPIAQFDKQADRWVLMQPVFTKPYYLCVAVSQTPDATGKYNLYQFPVPNNSKYFPDYPKLAVWPDGYYISFNTFQGNTYLGPTACVADRSSMLTGAAASLQCTKPLGSSYSPLLPADLDGALPGGVSGTTSPPPSGEADYYLNFGSNSLNVWQFNSSHTTFSLIQTISVPSFSEACGGGACIPQLGTNEQLDSLGDRMMYRLVYRNLGTASSPDEVLVANQSVDAVGTQVGARWYELEHSGTAGFAVKQEGTWAPSDGNDRWMGSIAMDKAQDIALGYSVSSSLINPEIAFTGNDPSAGDPSGILEAETSIINGTGSQTSYNRWGDYSSMSVDPTDDCTFWYTNEYLQATGNFNWSTQIAPIRFSSCPTLALSVVGPSGSSPDPASQTVTAGSPATYDLSVNPSGGSTVTTSFTVSGLPNGASYSVGSVTGQGSTTLTVNTSSSTPAGMYTLDIAATGGGITNVSSVVLTVNSSSAVNFSLSASPSSLSVTQGSSSNSAITVTPSGGFTGNVSLSVTSSLPTGMSVSFSPTPVSITGTSSASSTMTVSTTSSTPAGTYNLAVTGTSGSLSNSTTVAVTVNAASSGGDFSLTASPSSQSIKPAGSTAYTVTVTSSSGFSGSVSLSVSGLPKFANGSFSPNPVTVSSDGTASSNLSVKTNRKVAAGTYTLTITGKSGSLTHSTTVSLTVQ